MIITFIVVISIVIDQYTKYLAVSHLKGNPSFPIIDGVLHFTYTENTGAAFSILRGMQSFLVIVTSIGMALMFVFLVKMNGESDKILLRVSLALVISGGIGNLIDRLRLGYVVDFVDFRLINFAVFNLADAFITIGAILIIIDTFFVSKSLLK